MIRQSIVVDDEVLAIDLIDLDAGTVTRQEGGTEDAVRELTDDERLLFTQPQIAANRTAIEDKATRALATNAKFLALTTPTNAQTLAQVKALTRENTAIIRLLLNRLDTDEGT